MRPIRFRLFKRGPWWWLDVNQSGRRERIPCGTQRRGEADAFLDGERARRGDPTYVPPPAQAFSVISAVAEFREHGLAGRNPGTARMYDSKVGHFARVLGAEDAGALQRRHVDLYVAKRRSELAKDHTIAKELTTIRQCLQWCESVGKIAPGWKAAFPTRFRTGYDPRDRWLEEAEYLALLEACEPDRRLWITAACYTGGRESELKRIDCQRDLDFKRGFVTLRTAKVRQGDARRPRHIPMAPELRRALKAAGAHERLGPLFPSPWKNAALMVTRMARKAGICGESGTVNNNDLRRTFASWMLQRGAAVKEVADLLGHGSTVMVERVYGHLARKNLIRAVGRLPDFARPR
jgi:integrase